MVARERSAGDRHAGDAPNIETVRLRFGIGGV